MREKIQDFEICDHAAGVTIQMKDYVGKRDR